MEQVIVRHGHPNGYDHAPQGTICMCILDKTVWKQISKEEENPLWDEITESHPFNA